MPIRKALQEYIVAAKEAEGKKKQENSDSEEDPWAEKGDAYGDEYDESDYGEEVKKPVKPQPKKHVVKATVPKATVASKKPTVKKPVKKKDEDYDDEYDDEEEEPAEEINERIDPFAAYIPEYQARLKKSLEKDFRFSHDEIHLYHNVSKAEFVKIMKEWDQKAQQFSEEKEKSGVFGKMMFFCDWIGDGHRKENSKTNKDLKDQETAINKKCEMSKTADSTYVLTAYMELVRVADYFSMLAGRNHIKVMYSFNHSLDDQYLTGKLRSFTDQDEFLMKNLNRLALGKKRTIEMRLDTKKEGLVAAHLLK